MSAFLRGDDGAIFHTYSSHSRGIEAFVGTLMILASTPRGRSEDVTMSFVRRHDEYEGASPRSCCAHD